MCLDGGERLEHATYAKDFAFGSGAGRVAARVGGPGWGRVVQNESDTSGGGERTVIALRSFALREVRFFFMQFTTPESVATGSIREATRVPREISLCTMATSDIWPSSTHSQSSGAGGDEFALMYLVGETELAGCLPFADEVILRN